MNSMYGRLGFISHDRSVKAMLESGAEIDEMSLSLLKRQWRVPMRLKSVVASLVGWYMNSPGLAEGFRTPLYARSALIRPCILLVDRLRKKSSFNEDPPLCK